MCNYPALHASVGDMKLPSGHEVGLSHGRYKRVILGQRIGVFGSFCQVILKCYCSKGLPKKVHSIATFTSDELLPCMPH